MSLGPLQFSSQRLRFFGLASGLDIDQIISQLMQVERIPLDRLEQRRELLVWTKQDYLGIYTLLDQVRQALTPLKLASTFQARTAASSAENVATATASSGTSPGTHTLKVVQLAKGIQLASSDRISRTSDRSTLWTQFGIDSSVSSFTLKLQMTDSQGTRSAELTFSQSDPARDDINDLVAAINNSGLGLTAYYDATFDRLFISSQQTGASVTLQVTDTQVTLTGGTASAVWQDLFKLGNTASPFTGQDAIFDLDGATGLSSPTNQFTVGGVTYTLNGAGTATITVAQDTDSILAAVGAFVDKYNEALATINQKVSERRLYDYPPLTDAQKKEMSQDEIKQWEEKARQGLLQGDTLLLSVVSRVRRSVSDPVKGTGSAYTTLASVGITTGPYQEGGRLYLDEAKLRQALQQDPDGVMKLFTAQGVSSDEQGIAIRLGGTLNDALEQIRLRAGVMGLDTDNSGLGRQIAWLDAQIQAMEERLRRTEERYYRQYSLMEQVVGQLTGQSAWLAQVFLGQSQR